MTTRTNYSDVLRRAARRHDIGTAPAVTVTLRLLRDDAAVLNALAAIVAEIEGGTSDDSSPHDFCNRIAAGYRATPTEETQG